MLKFANIPHHSPFLTPALPRGKFAVEIVPISTFQLPVRNRTIIGFGKPNPISHHLAEKGTSFLHGPCLRIPMWAIL